MDDEIVQMHLRLSSRSIIPAARHILHHNTLPASQACVPTCRSAEFDGRVVDLLLSAGADIRASRYFTRSPLDSATLILSGGYVDVW
jgi:hypothetical protein